MIDDTPNEFPRHRGSLTAKPYRYGYCAQPSTDPRVGWPTLKHDLADRCTRQVFDHGAGRAAGEPVFVARPGATDEDDGWLVTFVHDLPTDTGRVRRARRPGLRPRLRRPRAAPPAGAVRLPRQLGQRPLGGAVASDRSCSSGGRIDPNIRRSSRS